MPETTARVAATLLALVFALAAGGKVLRWREWRSSIEAYGLPRPLEASAAAAVPVAETVVVAFLTVGETRAGAAGALFLLAVFSLALVHARSERGDRLPCGCFGHMRLMDARTMLARNGLLGVLSAVTLAGDEISLLEGLSAPTSDEILPALLISVGFAVGLLTIGAAFAYLRDRGEG